MDVENTTYSGIGKDFEKQEKYDPLKGSKKNKTTHEDFMSFTEVVGTCKICGEDVIKGDKSKEVCSRCKK